MTTLRIQALVPLICRNPDQKAALTRVLGKAGGPVGALDPLAEPPGVPGRPDRPILVDHRALKPRSMATVEGRAALIHALAHIELNAIDLALDLCWRFAGMPDEFYWQWVGVAQEEALHFQLLRDHLLSIGFAYGDFPAHNALWEMAQKTQGDILARIDDRILVTPKQLQTLITKHKPGDHVEVTFIRRGEKRKVKVMLMARERSVEELLEPRIIGVRPRRH